MALTRVRMSCLEYGLTEQIVSVGWDTVLGYKLDDFFNSFILEPKEKITIHCSDLPKFQWDVDEVGNPWASFILMDNGCYIFQVYIDLFCSNVWSEVWDGVFSSTEWLINLDEKYVEIKMKQDDYISCIKKNWTDLKNIYDVGPSITVRPYITGYNITEEYATTLIPCEDITPPIVADYCLEGLLQGDFDLNLCTWIYHRETKEGTCVSGLPVEPDTFSTWEILEDNCPAAPIFWRCPSSTRLPYNFRNGRLLSSVIEYLFTHTGCGLPVVSNFFNINPDATSPSNSAYDASLDFLQHLIVFQKSDIKRYDSSLASNSVSWKIKLKDLLEDLFLMFKAVGQVDGDTFRLEHISYFEAIAGNDYTNEYYLKQLQRDNSDTPRLTRFQYRDEQCSDYFKGFPIEIFCGEGEKELRLSQFSNDLAFITNVDNAESIGDAGWVLMSTNLVGGIYRNIQENRSLSWSELHQNYHVYQMPGSGKINELEVIPVSIMKTRKQPEFTVKKCCTDTFDPVNYITTSLGQGKVIDADWNLTEETLTLTAKY